MRWQGAPADAAGLEVLLAAPTLFVEQGPLRLGLAGEHHGRAHPRRRHAKPRRRLARADIARGRPARLAPRPRPRLSRFFRRARLPPVLGSRSTFTRAGFGGIDGRALESGDVLPCLRAESGDFAAPPLMRDDGPIRFIPGPQEENFTPDALALFIAAEWRAGADSDRMGVRLVGAEARASPRRRQYRFRRRDARRDPGSRRRPAHPVARGLPDLRRLCQDRLRHISRSGARSACPARRDLRFAPVGPEEAAAARKAAREKFAQWREKIVGGSGRIGRGKTMERKPHQRRGFGRVTSDEHRPREPHPRSP